MSIIISNLQKTEKQKREQKGQPNSKPSPQQAVTKFAILAFAIGYPRRYTHKMKTKLIGILFLVSTIFSIVDTIYYSFYLTEKVHRFQIIVPLNELYLYVKTFPGNILTFMSIAPLLYIWYLVSKIEKDKDRN